MIVQRSYILYRKEEILSFFVIVRDHSEVISEQFVFIWGGSASRGPGFPFQSFLSERISTTIPSACRFRLDRICMELIPRELIRTELNLDPTHRLDLRITNLSPDQISSMAQTLMSTKPNSKANSRIKFSFKSVGTFEDFFGHETQIIPFPFR